MNRLERWVLEQLEDPERRVKWIGIAYGLSILMLALGAIVIIATLLG